MCSCSQESGVLMEKSLIVAIYKRVIWNPENTIAFTQHLNDFLKINCGIVWQTLFSGVIGVPSCIVSIAKQLLWIEEMTIFYTVFLEINGEKCISLTKDNSNFHTTPLKLSKCNLQFMTD